jgi:hypothetical protein
MVGFPMRDRRIADGVRGTKGVEVNRDLCTVVSRDTQLAAKLVGEGRRELKAE